jgi:5-methylcytosine-specific restriction endonuclease McrA
MTRQAKWVKAARKRLLEELGGCCQRCGTMRKLEFDHIIPATRHWVNEQHGTYKRMLIYRAEAKLGLLQVLCRKHNAQKGQNRKQQSFV